MDCNKWRVIVDETPHSALEQMAVDRALAEEAIPTVRFFCWDSPAVSLGWKQPHPEWLASRAWLAAGCERVERPTGGGLAFHGSDLSISITVPRAEPMSLHALMDAVCGSAVALCRSYGADAYSPSDALNGRRIAYCLTETSPYAARIGAQKVAGFALRRFPRSWLVQGSLLVRPISDTLARALPPELLDSLRDRAVALSETATERVDEPAAAHRWAASWFAWWAEPLGRNSWGPRSTVDNPHRGSVDCRLWTVDCGLTSSNAV